MMTELKRSESEDIGISMADATALKATLLHCIREGQFDRSGTAEEMAEDAIAALKRIDNEFFIRDELEAAYRKSLTAEQK